MAVEVRVSGPLLTGRASAELRTILDEARRELADHASSYVHGNLNASIRNPTPYYETQIITERAGDGYVVHDRGIIYGPWLEGVGSRNRTTRFKGYFSFRRAAQRLQGEATGIVEQAIAQRIGRLG